MKMAFFVLCQIPSIAPNEEKEMVTFYRLL